MGSANSQDIQLCGMAIQAEHCIIDMTENNGVELTPHRNARSVCHQNLLHLLYFLDDGVVPLLWLWMRSDCHTGEPICLALQSVPMFGTQ